MSKPNAAEVVSKAETLGFAQRVKFGAKLGAQHGADADFKSLLTHIRTVRYSFLEFCRLIKHA